MGIQINGNTDTISAIDGGLTLSGADLGVSAGTTAAPSISPTGDSNTGIFFPSADTVAIAEGGVEALRVDSSGRIGIGTAGPTHLLELRTASSNIFKIVATSEGGVPLIVAANANTVTPTNQFFVAHNLEEVNIGNARSAALTLHTGNTEKLRIDSSGRVTMPYQPAFMVRGDETGSKAENTKFAFTSSGGDSKCNFDRLGNWSNANDRFTAPVAGIYNFYFGLYRQSATSTIFSVAPRVNNSQLSMGDTFIFFTAATGESGNTDDGMYGTFTFNLAANDYVELFMRGGAQTISIYYGHTFFGGHLIG